MRLAERIELIQERIISAHARSSKAIESPPQLVAVSKKQPVELINDFLSLQHNRKKQVILGENYVQEFRDKKPLLKYPVTAHLIGPLQSNKVKLAVELFDLIESVHSLDILAAINKHAAVLGKIMPVFLQINISGDANKSGFLPLDLDLMFFQKLAEFKNVKIKGLMTITQFYQDAELARPDFAALYKLSRSFAELTSQPQLELSMGMSNDFEVAIEEGATYVRIEGALFGERV